MGFFGILINKRSYRLSKKENHQILLPENVKVIEPVEELYPIKLTLFCLATSCITLPFYLRFLRKLSKLYQSVDTGKTLSYSSIEGASVLIFFLGVCQWSYRDVLF